MLDGGWFNCRWLNQGWFSVLWLWSGPGWRWSPPEIDHQQKDAQADGAICQIKDREDKSDLSDAKEQKIGDIPQAEAVNQVSGGSAQDKSETKFEQQARLL